MFTSWPVMKLEIRKICRASRRPQRCVPSWLVGLLLGPPTETRYIVLASFGSPALTAVPPLQHSHLLSHERLIFYLRVFSALSILWVLLRRLSQSLYNVNNLYCVSCLKIVSLHCEQFMLFPYKDSSWTMPSLFTIHFSDYRSKRDSKISYCKFTNIS